MESISSQIETFTTELRSSEDTAIQRKRSLDSGLSFPALLTENLKSSLQRWLDIARPECSLIVPLKSTAETCDLVRILNLYRRLAEGDTSLEEEIGLEGAHAYLAKLIKFDGSNLENEADQDVVLDMQDLACEIAALSTSFPMRAAPFTMEELRERLPLFFSFFPVTAGFVHEEGEAEEDGGFTILINQVHSRQTSQKDVGFGK